MTEQQAYNQKLIAEYRATRDNPDWPFAGRPLLLLTTTGAKTGQAHTTPIMYVIDGTDWLVIASNAGAPNHPDWYSNLVAHPLVTLEIGTETFPASAHIMTGDERRVVWERIVTQYPFFTDHQVKIHREIPVIRLHRTMA
jgi:deazaflavin-dependent oxidoreductase (nitroreductase family)